MDLLSLLGPPAIESPIVRAMADYVGPAPETGTRVSMHSSKNDRWFSPEHIVEAGRRTLGRFDVDPASEALANTVVRAMRIITAEEDGLVSPWRLPGQAPVTVWLNPPGGLTAERKSLAGAFWIRLMRERSADNLESAVFVAFNLELLQSTQNSAAEAGVLPVGSFLCCVPKQRVRYWAPEGRKMSSPTHGSVIVYVPGTENRMHAFIENYRPIGSLLVGV